jgi:hypothetical protein
MPERYYILSEGDAELFRQWKYERDRTIRNQRPKHQVGDSPNAHGPYAAKTPEGGIPARVGNRLGSATCTIYRVSEVGTGGELEEMDDLSQLVFNLDTAPIAGNIYTPIFQERYGQWIASPPGTGTGLEVEQIEVVVDVTCFAGLLAVTKEVITTIRTN